MKKIFFGVAVVAIALSASAFTNIDEGDFYVQDPLTGDYILIPLNSFDPINCEEFEDICAYEVVTEQMLSPEVSAEEIADLEIDGVDDAVVPVINPATQEPYLGAYDFD